jgi:hypothetical protein
MENITNITKIPNGFTISGKNYVFTGDATIINDTSAHIVTDQGIIYVDTSSTVEDQRFEDINAFLTSADFKGTIHNTPEPIMQKGYTGDIPIFDGKSNTNFLNFQDGLLVGVKNVGDLGDALER